MAKLEPRCLIGKGHAYSATGYLIPCCWTDPYEIGDGVYEEAAQEIADIFFKEELKLSNVETVYDILQSEAWVNFYNTLVNDELQLMEYWKLQRKANIQEDMRLLEILSNKSQKLPKN